VGVKQGERRLGGARWRRRRRRRRRVKEQGMLSRGREEGRSEGGRGGRKK
jgi:hypothetical protein